MKTIKDKKEILNKAIKIIDKLIEESKDTLEIYNRLEIIKKNDYYENIWNDIKLHYENKGFIVQEMIGSIFISESNK